MRPPLMRLPLNALRVFEAVGRLGSMARAAEALNVQPSAVSMQLRHLGEYVGQPLLERQGRGVVLTPQGEELLRSVSSGLGQIERTILDLRQATRQTPFTLSVLPAFLHRWLMPRLPGLERANRRLAVRVLASRHLADLARGEADAAIRLGGGRWPGVTSRRLMDEFLVPVCAPSVRRRVSPVEPGELPRGAPLLSTSVDPWSRWCPGAADDGGSPAVAIDDALAVIAAAEQGQGVALTRLALVADALAQGRLIALAAPIPYRWAYHWVTPRRPVEDRRGDAVFAWLREQAGQPAGPG